MKGLFSYSYYYHEWEYLICVSEREEKLVKKFDSFSRFNDEVLVIDDEQYHSILGGKEQSHYMIKDIEVI